MSQLPEPQRKPIKLPGVTAAPSESRDAIANMLRQTTNGGEKTNVGDSNDLVTDVSMSDPHDAVTVTSDADESFVTVAEPLPGPDVAHASLIIAAPSAGVDGGASSAQAAAVASPGADEKDSWHPAATSDEPARGFFANRKRTLIAAIAAAVLVIVVVAMVAGRDSKPSSSASSGTPEKTAVAKAEPPKDDIAPEPAVGSGETPTAVEVGSAEALAGSAEAQPGSADAPVVEPEKAGSADGSAETAAPSAVEDPAPAPAKPAPAKVVAKKPAKRVAAKPATKPAAKKPVAKTTKTATKTSKPAVQKPGVKKPAWDPNSLLPPKKK